MPLDQFTDEAYQGLAAGNEEVVVGIAQKWYGSFEPQRQECFRNLVHP